MRIQILCMCFVSAILQLSSVNAQTGSPVTFVWTAVKFLGTAAGGKLVSDLTSDIYKNFKGTASDVNVTFLQTKYECTIREKYKDFYDGTWTGVFWVDLNTSKEHYSQTISGHLPTATAFPYRWEHLRYYCAYLDPEKPGKFSWLKEINSSSEGHIGIKTITASRELAKNNDESAKGVAIVNWDLIKQLDYTCNYIPDKRTKQLAFERTCGISSIEGNIRWTKVPVPLGNEYSDHADVYLRFFRY